MKEVNLKFSHEYNNYSGNADFKVRIVSANPNEIATGVKGFTVSIDEDVEFHIQNEDEVRTAVLPAGNYLASARGGQFNPELHIEGNETNIGFSWKEGETAPLINLLPSNLVRGVKPVFTFVSQEVDAFEVIGHD